MKDPTGMQKVKGSEPRGTVRFLLCPMLAMNEFIIKKLCFIRISTLRRIVTGTFTFTIILCGQSAVATSLAFIRATFQKRTNDKI